MRSVPDKGDVVFIKLYEPSDEIVAAGVVGKRPDQIVALAGAHCNRSDRTGLSMGEHCANLCLDNRQAAAESGVRVRIKSDRGRGTRIIIADIDYLEGAIYTGVLLAPIHSVRPNRSSGVNCAVTVPVRGLGAKNRRVLNTRTIWELTDAHAPPRLVSAYPKP